MPGKVGALFVMGDDPVSALPNGAAAMGEVGFLVVQDAFMTATAAAADVVLPGATFAEKEGTFTSTERRVQRVRKAVDAPGEARGELEVLSELSARLGRGMSYGSAAEVMEELAAVSPIYAGLSFEGLEGGWGVRWPLEAALGAGDAGGRANGSAIREENAAPITGDDYPLVLAADYALGAWSNDVLVGNTIGLRRQKGADRRAPGRLLVSREDAERLDLRPGAEIRVRSQKGELKAETVVSEAVRPGVVLMAAEMLAAADGALHCRPDPETGVPRMAPCAVRIEKL
jgi:predicted molibdopterin-dependent oxidoreductase YjgC